TFFDKKARKSYLTNTILKVDLKTKLAKVAADLLRFYHPLTELHWRENTERDRFVTWGKPPADHDFSHANSIRLVPDQGYVVSFKHLDRLAMFSLDFKRVLWSIGRTAQDTYRTHGRTQFSHQH